MEDKVGEGAQGKGPQHFAGRPAASDEELFVQQLVELADEGRAKAGGEDVADGDNELAPDSAILCGRNFEELGK
jgi:hypothetical protein